MSACTSGWCSNLRALSEAVSRMSISPVAIVVVVIGAGPVRAPAHREPTPADGVPATVGESRPPSFLGGQTGQGELFEGAASGDFHALAGDGSASALAAVDLALGVL